MTSKQYFEKKSDVDELRHRLQTAIAKKNTKLCKSTVKKIIQYMTLGVDVSSLFKDVIMALSTNDVVQKKLIYLYICTCAESNPDLVLLTVNTLVKDCMGDHNPMIRGLALRSMLNMRISLIVEYVKSPLLVSLDDKSPYVRRTAVIGCLKLYKLAPDIFEDMDLLEKIEAKRSDPDPEVTLQALNVLDEILFESGGFQFNRTNVTELLGRLTTFNEWSQCMVLEKIVRYQPEDESEILEYLNFLDDRLNHSNKGVVLAVTKTFLHFTKSLDNIKSDVYERIKGPILSILSTAIPEIVYTTLNHVIVLIRMKPRLFHKDYKFFFLRNNDPSYVCHKKLEVLTEVVTEGNMQILVNEIREYVHNPDYLISSQASRSIGIIALKNSFAVDVCVDALLDLLQLDVHYVTGNCLESLQELMQKHNEIVSQILPMLSDAWQRTQDHSSGKAALVWMYGEFGEKIPNSPYLLEELVDNIVEVESVAVKLNLLTAVMKLFFHRPPECQKMLGRLLKYCIDKEKNMDVRDRALFYYRLLQKDFSKARSLVFSKEQESSRVDERYTSTIDCQSFMFKEFNTLSIVYGQPSETFLQNICIVSDSLSVDELDETDQNAIVTSSQRVVQPQQQQGSVEIPVDQILDLDQENDVTDNKTSKLDGSISLTSEEFKKEWFNATYVKRFDKELSVAPEHGEILSVMASSHIQCLATNPATESTWKFFFYAKKVHESGYYLIELVVMRKNLMMNVQIKSTNHGQNLDEFIEFFKELFIGRWIVLTP